MWNRPLYDLVYCPFNIQMYAFIYHHSGVGINYFKMLFFCIAMNIKTPRTLVVQTVQLLEQFDFKCMFYLSI